jgi:hypothetical protein
MSSNAIDWTLASWKSRQSMMGSGSEDECAVILGRVQANDTQIQYWRADARYGAAFAK